MQAVPTRPGGVDHARAGQHLQDPAGFVHRHVGQRGDRVALQVPAGVQAR